MGLVKGCLQTIGLVVCLLIGGCVFSLRSCVHMADPRVWSASVTEDPDKTRRMLDDYLQAATLEPDSAHVVAGRPTTVAVQTYTDGSIHLTIDGKGQRLAEVVANVSASDWGGSRVEVVSDAVALADAGHWRSPHLHQSIHDQIEQALSAIAAHRPLQGGFSVARMIRAGDATRF